MKQIITILMLMVSVGLIGQELSLDSCKTLALENNKRLKEAKLELKASKELKKEAFTNYFPNVSATGFAMRTTDYMLKGEISEMNLPVYDGNPANLATPTQFAYVPSIPIKALDYFYTGAIMAIQPLYVGGRIRNGNKLANLGTEINEELVKLSTDEVLVKTEEYYWMIVNLENKMKTLESYRALLKNLQNDVEVSYNAGLVQKSDLLKVQLKLNEIKANKLRLENGISLLKMTLSQHVGIEYSDSMMVADSIMDLDTPETAYNEPNSALGNRSEYLMLNKAVTAEQLQKKMAFGEHMPSLSVGVSGMYTDVMDTQSSVGLVFATLSIPISDWWGGSHKVREHKIKVEIAQNNLAEKSELLLLQMDKSFKDLSESFKQIEIAELSRNQAQEHFKVTQDNYKAGVVSTSDLLEAQAIFQEAQDALVDAKTTYKIRLANYKQVTAQRN